MSRPHLKLVSFRPEVGRPPPAELPEVLLVRRLDEVRDAWLWLPCTWFMPRAWLDLYSALERYGAQRLRMPSRR